MTFRKLWQYRHTHFVFKTKLDTKDNCTAFNFSDYFFKECTTSSTSYLY